MKFALLVGINKYDKPGNDLAGCINDVQDMHQAIIGRGFDARNIHILVDGAASKDAIIASLKWLIAKGRNPGDELLFCYSGHGSQVPSKDPEEVDHLAEIICPADMHKWWDDPLSDKVLKAIFADKPKGVNLTIFLDCCHSGHGTRNGGMDYIEHDRLPRWIPYPVELPQGDIPINRLGIKQTIDFRETSSKMNHVLLGACRDHQVAADANFGGRPNGAWTYHFLQALKFRPSIPLRICYTLARHNMQTEGEEQIPVLEGPLSMTDHPFVMPPVKD